MASCMLNSWSLPSVFEQCCNKHLLNERKSTEFLLLYLWKATVLASKAEAFEDLACFFVAYVVMYHVMLLVP